MAARLVLWPFTAKPTHAEFQVPKWRTCVGEDTNGCRRRHEPMMWALSAGALVVYGQAGSRPPTNARTYAVVIPRAPGC